ncbi:MULTISPECIES: hypothetical protein [Kitasatospora]|uniref:hypothetical protein n=1 Tax=Kitasatospora TaxID=2063 RepID=UPI0002DC92B1|nr:MULTISPECIES: hypothetical protein [Kitasatospora]
MNIDFSLEPLFSWYVVLLMVSGLITICLALVPASGLGIGMRVISGLIGAAFFGYGLYLGFFFEGGRYVIYFKVLFIPVAMIFYLVRSLVNRAKGTPAPPQYPAAYPPAQGQYPGQAPFQGEAPQQQPGQVPPQAPFQAPGQAPVQQPPVGGPTA